MMVDLLRDGDHFIRCEAVELFEDFSRGRRGIPNPFFRFAPITEAPTVTHLFDLADVPAVRRDLTLIDFRAIFRGRSIFRPPAGSNARWILRQYLRQGKPAFERSE